MRYISQEGLNKILKEHKLWLEGKGGEQADLRRVNLRFVSLRGADLRRANLRFVSLIGADLRGADLRGADLRFANLRFTNLRFVSLRSADLKGADLRCADLRFANLRFTDLRCANLKYANLKYANLNYADLNDANLKYAKLKGADLRDADLKFANLKYTNLSNADLIYADLKDVKTNINTLGYSLACPEKGSFIGYKKAGDCIVKLLIPSDAKRSSATTTKCRCSKAKVLDIENIETGEKVKEIRSNYDNNFIYKVGEIVTVNDFDDNRWNECSTGIHFFMNRENAIKYR